MKCKMYILWCFPAIRRYLDLGSGSDPSLGALLHSFCYLDLGYCYCWLKIFIQNTCFLSENADSMETKCSVGMSLLY